MDASRSNQFATFHQKQAVVQDICLIDRVFSEFARDWRNPSNPLSALLLLRSHSAYRVSAGAAMAGQAGEVPCLHRLSLECAGYAVIIDNDPTLGETWLRRGESDDARKAARKAFTPARIAGAVGSCEPKLATIFGKLYDEAIDFGAHPNELQMTSNLRILPGERERRFESIYLQGDGMPLDLALRRSVQIGIWCAKVFALLFPERASDEARAAIENVAGQY
jgi:hypothetical protein